MAENKSRGTIFSIYVTINMAASTLGQVAMSVTGTAGYVPFVIGAIAFACALLPTAMTSSPQPRPLSSAKSDRGLFGGHGQWQFRHAGAGLWLSARA